ncbi:Alg9-like mannosyltransferase family-domain-containing protein [Pelagophyceae sp. CCMP2097]|nr:Alg9-like mannosyltransferase family-domain-containing protein [Pelagophyceae sp. CCMP2097]
MAPPGPRAAADAATWTLRALAVLVPVQAFAALASGVSDCDEVFNYWEAVHLFAAGSSRHRVALQTWEYAPHFALRSWAFVAPYAGLARLFGALTGDAASERTFLFVRGLGVALPFAAAQAWLVGGVAARFGGGAALACLALAATSPGMFGASAALLPSSVALGLACASQGCWLRGRWRQATGFAVAAALWPGWPFVAALFLPFAVETLIQRILERGLFQGVFDVARCGVFWGAVIGLPVAAFDCYVYGAAVSPLLNVWRYNAGQSGDELYGIEPWTFYAKNMALNAGVPAGLLLLALPLAAVDSTLPARALLAHATPAVLWVSLLLARPHKEERFLFPALASVHVAAAVVLHHSAELVRRTLRSNAAAKFVFFGALAAAAAVGATRVGAVTKYYAEPQLAVWRAAGKHARALQPAAVTVCVGGEWYRYTSTFFLPPNARLGFVRSEFDGELPRHWERRDAWVAAARAPVEAHFNDRNVEELGRYVDAAQCDFAVDFDDAADGASDDSAAAPAARSLRAALRADRAAWITLQSWPFLDAGRTPAVARAFLIPGYSAKRAKYAKLVLLKRAETSDA